MSNRTAGTPTASHRPTPITQVELTALPPTIDVETAGRILGIGRALAYRLARQGEFPCRVLRAGRRYLVPRAELLRILGIGEDGRAVPDTDRRPPSSAVQPLARHPRDMVRRAR
jgi:hypothetical protein